MLAGVKDEFKCMLIFFFFHFEISCWEEMIFRNLCLETCVVTLPMFDSFLEVILASANWFSKPQEK